MDKYHKVKEIGKGNYGSAILMRNINDHNLYVIKLIDISNFNKAQLDNALYEVNVIKTLQHPYIIKYVESFYEENFLCIVMEYADCGDLYKLVKSQKKIGNYLKEEIILNWFVQLCFAVKYLHERKILHRDLKLSNVFICSNGDIKLGDFGISKILNDTDEYAMTLVGTPYYLSPEICLKQSYNQKSDIWSLGCILYEMMNLRHAFEALNIGELILKILKSDFEPVDESFSEDARNLIAEMLNTKADLRPDIKIILEKPFLLRYIKLNLVKQLTSKSSPVLAETHENEDGTELMENGNGKENKTRTWSSSSDSCKLNLKFSSIPAQSPEKDFEVKSIEEEMHSMYKIASDNDNDTPTDSHSNSKSSMKPRRAVKFQNQESNVEEKISIFSKIEKLKKILEKILGLEEYYIMVNTRDLIQNNKSSSQQILNIQFDKFHIHDKKMREDVVKLIKSLIKLENSMYNK